MGKLRWVFGLLTLILVGVAVYGMTLPTDFEIVRSKNIDAHSYKVNIRILNLKNWTEWWPWRDLKASGGFEFSEEASGEGARISWKGRPAPGTATVKNQSVHSLDYEVQFDDLTRPDSLSFEVRGGKLTIRFRGHSEIPVLGGYVALIADSMHGGMLDWALGNLKDLAEADTEQVYVSGEDGELVPVE